MLTAIKSAAARNAAAAVRKAVAASKSKAAALKSTAAVQASAAAQKAHTKTRLRAEVQTAAAMRYQRMYAPGGNPFNDTFRSSRGSNLSAKDIFRFVNELQWGSLKK